MNKLNLIFALMLVSLLPFTSNAVELTLLGGINMASGTAKVTQTAAMTAANATGTYTMKSQTTMAGGVLVDFPYMGTISFETGLLYKKAKSKDTLTLTIGAVSASSETTNEMTRLQIPFLVRYTKLPVVSFGLGGYWETGSGGVKQTTSTGSQNISYGQAGLWAPDYGLLGDIRFTANIAPKIGLVLDANYSYGLAERSKDKATMSSIKTSALAVLGGVKVAF